MKKPTIALLVILSIWLLVGFRFLKPARYICPIRYQDNIIIRCDGRGDGFFASGRSGGRLHNGIDFYARVGTPIIASRSGRVIAAKRNFGMGNYVIIRHRGNITTVYGHLNKIYVKKNQSVRQGKVIGSVGKTGNARFRDIKPHLHFEIRKKGLPQDPLDYLEETKTKKICSI